jgi:methyl-accepting chemotaxis protein
MESPPVATAPASIPPSQDEVIARARQLVPPDGGWNLFVLDRTFTVIHLSAEAERAAAAVDGELRRAFGLGAANLRGVSIFRFHPAPTQLEGLLVDPSRLPHEATWSFGHVVWAARLLAIPVPDGPPAGYAILWRDESEACRAMAVIARLRAQSEELPVPIMFPDPTGERWFGNAACEHALERLAPHLPHPVNPLEGIPASLFIPDPERRRALLHRPDRLPHKFQMQVGPERVSVLISPIRDQEQRFLGPQITWEIVHFTAAPDAPPAVEPPGGLRDDARALSAAAADLHTLTRLLDTAADLSQGRTGPSGVEAGDVGSLVREGEEAARRASEAHAELARVPVSREAMRDALATLNACARRTGVLALEAGMLAVRAEAATGAGDLRARVREVGARLEQDVAALTAQAQAAVDRLRDADEHAARLAELRATLGGEEPV